MKTTAINQPRANRAHLIRAPRSVAAGVGSSVRPAESDRRAPRPARGSIGSLLDEPHLESITLAPVHVCARSDPRHARPQALEGTNRRRLSGPGAVIVNSSVTSVHIKRRHARRTPEMEFPARLSGGEAYRIHSE